MKITLRQLRLLGACEPQVELFKATFGTEVELTEANAIRYGALFDINWIAGKVLKGGELADYDAKCAPLYADYRVKLAPLTADYWAKCATLDADYEAKRAPLLADYEAKRAPLLADYKAKGDALDADYEAKLAPLDADYWAGRAPLWADYKAKCALVFTEVISI